MKKIIYTILPGIMVAATGVGAGDLITASLAGVHSGYTLIWAIILGVIFKWTLNEGLTRFQMASELTLLEGILLKLPKFFGWYFLIYLLIWTFMVGGGLSKCLWNCRRRFSTLRP